MNIKQKPKKCEHCGKIFKSGAGAASHLRWVTNGPPITRKKGSKLVGQELEKQREYIAKAALSSPNHIKKGQRFSVKCKLCNKEFWVVESQVKRRKYCSKSCSAKVNMKGSKRTISKETRKKMSDNMKKRLAENPKSNPFYGRTPTNYKGFGFGGHSEELGHYYRSSWELEYCTALKEAGVDYVYEPKRFDLKDCTYMPDIYLPNTNFYIEITGWDKQVKKDKRKKFREIYPDLILHVIKDKPTEETKKMLVQKCQEVAGNNV